jgi:hypothetical protein
MNIFFRSYPVDPDFFQLDLYFALLGFKCYYRVSNKLLAEEDFTTTLRRDCTPSDILLHAITDNWETATIYIGDQFTYSSVIILFSLLERGVLNFEHVMRQSHDYEQDFDKRHYPSKDSRYRPKRKPYFRVPLDFHSFYIKDLCGIDLSRIAHFQDLVDLNLIRDCLAHYYGNIPSMDNGQRQQLQNLCHENIHHIENNCGTFELEDDCIPHFFNIVVAFFNTLITTSGWTLNDGLRCLAMK